MLLNFHQLADTTHPKALALHRAEEREAHARSSGGGGGLPGGGGVRAPIISQCIAHYQKRVHEPYCNVQALSRMHALSKCAQQ